MTLSSKPVSFSSKQNVIPHFPLPQDKKCQEKKCPTFWSNLFQCFKGCFTCCRKNLQDKKITAVEQEPRQIPPLASQPLLVVPPLQEEVIPKEDQITLLRENIPSQIRRGIDQEDAWNTLFDFQNDLFNDPLFTCRDPLPHDRYDKGLPYNWNALQEEVSASWIKIPDMPVFIASQAPIPSHFGPFLKTVQKYEVEDIIVLHDLDQSDIDPYWASALGEKFEGYTFRQFTDSKYFEEKLLKHDNGTYLRIHHYKSWKDCDVVDAETLYQFIREVDKSLNSEKPIWIHCSAGIGRTGTFLTAYFLYLTLKNGVHRYTIPQWIAMLRLERPWLVGLPTQLDLIYEVNKLIHNEFDSF